MEWDNVMVFDKSLMTLSKYRTIENVESVIGVIDCRGCSADGLNLWYVAVTRAKKRLSIPKKLENLLNDWEAIAMGASRYDIKALDESDGNCAKKARIKDEDESVVAPASGTNDSAEKVHISSTEDFTLLDAKIIHRDVVAPASRAIVSRNGLIIDEVAYIYNV